ncbi:Mss4p nuclear export [Kappamyces sp. JEL0829]|nr:Mss4p nuclear export [Kappamyces sp. JEL0829]
MKRNVDSSSGSDYSGSDNEDSKAQEPTLEDGGWDEGEEINVDFDFVPLSDIDFHGLKTLLKQTFAQDIDSIEDSALADYLIGLGLGTVVKLDDNLDPYALISCLDGEQGAHHSCVEQVVNLIKQKASPEALSVLNKKRIGVVLNDRLINMPPQIAPSLFKFLHEEIQAQIKSNKTKPFDYLVYISKIYHQVQTAEGKGKAASGKGTDKKIKRQEPHFYQAEDEFIAPFAQMHFDYDLPKQQASDSRRVFNDDGIEQSRRVYILPFSCLGSLVEALETNVV